MTAPRSVAALAALLTLAARDAGAAGATPAATARPVLRVCADPNNLPFSNQRGEGFENKIAARLAAALGAELQYTWWAQRRGFVRNSTWRWSGARWPDTSPGKVTPRSP